VYQSLTRIDKDMADGTFAQNPVITDAIDQAIRQDKAIHIFGLLSSGGVHSHEEHLFQAIRIAAARGAKRIFLHAFLDGRDTPPRSAEPSLQKADAVFAEVGVGRTASVVGRYFAMDRDNRWDRVESAYNLITLGEAAYQAASGPEALQAAYERGENDEFVSATRIQADGQEPGLVDDGDTVIFMNFRADRARQLTRTFVEEGFQRKRRPKLASFVMLTEYSADLKIPCAYPPESLDNSLGEYMSKLGKTQLRIAETEKYAHVTFFFSGGREAVYPGEDRILVPSPNGATYDLKPEMSAPEVTATLAEAIRSRKYDLLVVNSANGDMVGHSGKFDAAVKAAECLDHCLARLADALAEVDGQALITADHGNLEQLQDEQSGQAHTHHTPGPVRLLYLGSRPVELQVGGSLADIAPSLLSLMGLPQPEERTGPSLVRNKYPRLPVPL